MSINSTNNDSDALDKIIQQMLVDYMAWTKGEPVAWNVKKLEAKAAIKAHYAAEIRAALQDLKYKAETRKVISPKMITIYEETFITLSDLAAYEQNMKEKGLL